MGKILLDGLVTTNGLPAGFPLKHVSNRSVPRARPAFPYRWPRWGKPNRANQMKSFILERFMFDNRGCKTKRGPTFKYKLFIGETCVNKESQFMKKSSLRQSSCAGAAVCRLLTHRASHRWKSPNFGPFRAWCALFTMTTRQTLSDRRSNLPGG